MFDNLIASVVATASGIVRPLGGSVQGELQAYQRDKNPDHLLNAISLQQAIIKAQGDALNKGLQYGAILEGAMNGLDPSTPGPFVERQVMQLIEDKVSDVTATVAAAGSTAGRADIARFQQDMQRMQQMLDMLSTMIQKRTDMAKSAVQNMR
jgi:hypothetical protein